MYITPMRVYYLYVLQYIVLYTYNNNTDMMIYMCIKYIIRTLRQSRRLAEEC